MKSGLEQYFRAMRWFRAFAAILLCLFYPARPAAAQRSVAQVTITASWGGLGKPEKTEVIIRQDGNSFRSGRQKIDGALVSSLVSALNEETIEKVSLANLGITDAWLKSMVNKDDVSPYWAAGAPNQKDLFVGSFTDVSTVAEVVPRLFDFVRTDDYPAAEVHVTFEDGSAISASSLSQYQFMLPWKVDRNGGVVTTFNANLSRAVAALMPNKATNRSRMAGEGLERDLAEVVKQQIKNKWNMLGVQNNASDTLTLLRGQYTIESADINRYHNVDYGKKWSRGGPQETNLQVTVKRPSFPKSFSERVILLYDGGEVYGAQDFLRTVGAYEELVNSVPWLTRFSQDNPNVPIQLVFVHDRSFGEKAMTVFSADMKAIGKEKLVEEVQAVQDRVALVAAGFGGYWLVLPDRRMILWRYSTRAGLLQFGAFSNLATRRCSDYNGVTGGCVGAVVSPDGTLSN